MRCYLIRDCRIAAVTLLPTTEEAKAIELSSMIFAQRYREKFESFEVWDRTRFIYRQLSESGESI